ncbi:unnamed protein product, partial [Coccothraustes coccothraustes]
MRTCSFLDPAFSTENPGVSVFNETHPTIGVDRRHCPHASRARGAGTQAAPPAVPPRTTLCPLRNGLGTLAPVPPARPSRGYLRHRGTHRGGATQRSVFNMAGTGTATTFLHEAQCNVTRWRRRWTAEEKDRAQRSPGAGSLARGPLRCCAAAGVVNQAVTSQRTATSQHQGRTAPRFHRRLEKSSVSCGQARDVEHLLAASTQAQTCKGNQVLNSYLGTSLPLKSEIEVRPLNISVGLAPKPCVTAQCRASAGTGQHCQQHGRCLFTCHI